MAGPAAIHLEILDPSFLLLLFCWTCCNNWTQHVHSGWILSSSSYIRCRLYIVSRKSVLDVPRCLSNSIGLYRRKSLGYKYNNEANPITNSNNNRRQQMDDSVLGKRAHAAVVHAPSSPNQNQKYISKACCI